MVVVLVLIVAVVLLFIVGWAVLGLVFKLLWWALLGLLIGALARLVLPGRQAISWLATIGAGIAGALLGGSSRTPSTWGRSSSSSSPWPSPPRS